MPEEPGGAGRGLRSLSLAAGILPIIAGALILVGWHLDIGILKSGITGLVSVKANVAVTFIISGIACLILANPSRSGRMNAAFLFLSGFIIVMGAINLAQDLLGLDLGIDELLYREPAHQAGGYHPGRPAFLASLNFVLLGSSLLLHRSGRLPFVAESLAILPALMAFRSLLGYFFNVPALYAVGRYTAMALPGTVVFMSISSAILLARPGRGIMAHILSPRAGGSLFRRLTPLLTACIVLIALAMKFGQELGYYDERYGITLVVMLAVLATAFFAFRSAIRLNALDFRRTQMEHTLAEYSAELLDLYNKAPCGYHTLDVDGYFLRINDTELAWLGYRREEIIGTLRISDILTKESGKAFEKDFPLFLVTGRNSGMEASVVRKDGSVMNVLVNSALERGADGSPTSIRSIWIDVTEKKEMDLHLRESHQKTRDATRKLGIVRSKMEEQARLRALGEMASGIAHDINNTISPIVGFSETMLEWPSVLDDRKQTVEFLRLINKAANDAAGVVGRLRRFYQRKDSDARIRMHDVNQLINDSVLLTRPRWKNRAQSEGRTINVLTDLRETRLLACNDDDIREILINLITNSTDAMPAGGEITLTTEGSPSECTISVSDNGTGMTPEVRERCLEPFYTTKGVNGTGLGLATVSSSVFRHSGVMHIDPRPGGGTTVSIRFPRKKPVRGSIPKSRPLQAGGKLRILVVDDEPLIRRLLVENLTRDGHFATATADGREAIGEFSGGGYNLVISDRSIPDMKGDDLAIAIKHMSRTTPVIMVSGIHAAPGTAVDIPAAVDRIIGKPFTISDIRDAIASVMAGPAPATCSKREPVRAMNPRRSGERRRSVRRRSA